MLLAVIGDRWLDLQTADGRQRIDDPEDWVRIEIEAALKRGIPVIPVLIGNTSMPAAAQLPNELKPLSRRNAAEVRPGIDLKTGLERLVRDSEKALRYASRPSERAKQTSPSPKPPREGQPESPKPLEAEVHSDPISQR